MTSYLELSQQDPQKSGKSTEGPKESFSTANSSIDSLSLTPVTVHDIETNPQTPLLRLSLKNKVINTSFSPITNDIQDKRNKENIIGNTIGSNTLPCNESIKLAMKMAKQQTSTPSHLLKVLSESTPLQSPYKNDSMNLAKEELGRQTCGPNIKSDNLRSEKEKDETSQTSQPKNTKTVSFPPEEDSTFHEYKPYNRERSSKTPMLLTLESVNDGRSSRICEDDHGEQKSRSSSPTKGTKKKRKFTNTNNYSKYNQNHSNGLLNPQLPYILSLYLQLFFNVVIVSVILYFVYVFISTVKADVENKVDSYASEIIQEIAVCTREYHRNHCLPGQRVVALESACSNWERCMNRDPTGLGRAKIGAETFAEIINGFIKPISWKTIIFLSFVTVGSLILTNAAFGSYRDHSGIQRNNRHTTDDHSLQENYHGITTNLSQNLLPRPPQLELTPRHSPKNTNPSTSKYFTPSDNAGTNSPYVPGSGSGEIVRRKLRMFKSNK